jgi:hypothetical protein
VSSYSNEDAVDDDSLPGASHDESGGVSEYTDYVHDQIDQALQHEHEQQLYLQQQLQNEHEKQLQLHAKLAQESSDVMGRGWTGAKFNGVASFLFLYE